MKILVTGAEGMLGKDLVNLLVSSGHDVTPTTKKEVDITDMQKIEDVIASVQPELIINCAAYTDVDAAEDDKETCHRVNVVGVQNLVSICKAKDVSLVQISTDYVFDIQGEHLENDKKSPINYYGVTKSHAEDYIIDNLEKYYIVRTAWLFGKNGQNFVATISSLCKTQPEIKVVNDQVGSPTYTKDLSKAIISLFKKPYGIYHITNDGSCSWYEFAEEIVTKQNLDCRVIPCTTDEFPRKAKRPVHSILKNTKLAVLPHWKNALQNYLK